MNKNIEKTEQGYVLTATDGIRLILRGEDHRLWGTLTEQPKVGQAILRPLTDEEAEIYATLRRKEKNVAKVAKQAAADKARKDEAKAEKRRKFYLRKKEEKAANKAIQAETEQFTQVKALEKAEKPVTEKTVEPKEDLTNKEKVARAREQAKTNAEEKAKAEQEKAPAPAVNAPVEEAVANKEEVTPMKDVTNAQRLAHVLKQAKIPADAVSEIINKFSVTDMRHIVFAELKDELTAIHGIGDKRADTIIRVLTGRIPEPLAIKKLSAEMREQLKAEIREKAKGFSCRVYEWDELWREFIDRIEALKAYRPQKDEDPAKLTNMRKRMRDLIAEIKERKSLTVRYSEGRIVRLNKSAVAEVLGIDYESKRPTTKVLVLSHGVQELFDFHWKLFSNDKDEGQKLLDEFQQDLMYHIGYYGVRVLYRDGTNKLYGGLGSSAGHQKAEKLLMGDARIMKAHEKFFWFGKTMKDFVEPTTMTGAEFWKARANLLRPWMKPFTTKDSKVINIHDMLVVKDLKKVYEILIARRIGKKDGEMVHDGPTKEAVICGDGAMIAIYALAFQGQGSGTLFKGFVADGTSSIEELCRKHGISVEDFMNTMIEGIDGKMHRVGDYKIICGEGCWKGDKAFESYTAYLEWLDEMAESYPGIDNLYLLRQAEEIEDEDRVRRLTSSLIRQWMHMSPKEIHELTKRARCGLKKDKTFYGAVNKLAALWKSKEERTEVEKLFEECPWLVTAPVIQEYLSEQWKRKQIEACSGKFRTEGQYPYIMQDPVALLEIWVLGMSPDDPTLGVLKDGEVSCADVQDGRELLCVRFPANFLTAMVKKNRACRKAFVSLNGVMVLSIHDLILIAQDGDVDGDEMCVIYNRLAIKLTKRMQSEFNPPIVLFNHGGKPERKAHGTIDNFIRDAYSALWRAKKYDSVGIYANLAARCAYLAAIAYKLGNKKDCDQYLLWMSAASTGAILAIDQVKGNAVDPALIAWLDDINQRIKKIFRKMAEAMGISKEEAYMVKHPYTQYYIAAAKRAPIGRCECLPSNPNNYSDETTDLIERDTGTYEFDNRVKEKCEDGSVEVNNVHWNQDAAETALTSGRDRMKVPDGVVTKAMMDLLGDNWFKLRPKTEEGRNTDKTRAILSQMKVGGTVGLKDFILLLWRNESSMSYSMEGRQLWEKKEEYYGTCRTLLRMLCESGDWSHKKGVKTLEDRWDVLVNILVRDALELNLPPVKKVDEKTGEVTYEPGTNGVDKKGSYAMFVLKVIASDLRINVKKNRVDIARFFGITASVESRLHDIDEDLLEDEEELFESTPAAEVDEYSEIGDEPPMDEGYIEYLMSQCPPPEEECIGIICD